MTGAVPLGGRQRAIAQAQMPIYEYECHGCRRRVSLLVLAPSRAEPPTCPRCGSGELARLMSRFATVRSEDDRLESLADPTQYGDLDENDPRSVARFMKKMGQEMGDDLGEDFDAAMDEAMSEPGDGPQDADETGGEGGADDL
jgi:putative FmdB family regulatory protein